MNNKISTYAIGAVVLVLAIYLFAGSNAVISAQGYSSIKANPDLVSVYINIEAKNETAQNAKNMHSEIKNKLLQELERLGIAENEVELSYYNIYPNYEWNEREQTQKGFIASSQVIVKAEDFELVSEIVDAAVDSGALVSYINFELSPEKQNEYKKQALEKAGKDAKEKAEATAAGVGKKLGRLISIQSEEFNYYPVAYYERSADAVSGTEAKEAALSLAPRKIDVSAYVRTDYKVGLF